ncbi:hypothetical protein EW146_g5854 [Bondarzewia mesenterica]|uniref:Myb/SANT-like domain-containing protein n=1 Tax=Bondarzewia mesenterica TaxID=1095465 RepID=A0A4S4LQ96_9AGAM|nr:hypothetical protein EW146_g5854 [Bondarzewia mesenterica]
MVKQKEQIASPSDTQDPVAGPAQPAMDGGKAQCHWTHEDETAFIAFLQQEVEAGYSIDFTDPIFTAAALMLNKQLTKGDPKETQACQTKWSHMKETYHVVEQLMEQSAFSWSLDAGADIDIDSEHVWTDYVAKNVLAKPFRNTGWAHFDTVKTLIPSKDMGIHIFHPHLSPPVIPRNSSNSESDSEREDIAGLGDSAEDAAAGVSDIDSEIMYSSKRKFSRIISSSSNSNASLPIPNKRHRSSSRDALLAGVHQELLSFNDQFRTSLMQMPELPTPLDLSAQRKSMAIARLQEVEIDLQPDEVAALIDLFRDDISTADCYLAIYRESVRKAWIRRRLDEISLAEGS